MTHNNMSPRNQAPKKTAEKNKLATTVVNSAHEYNNRYNNHANPDQSSLEMNQTFNSHSIIHIVLSCITLPLAIATLREQYNHIKELKKKKFTRDNQSESLTSEPNDKHATNIYPSLNNSTRKTTDNDCGGSQFFQESHRSPEAINNNLIFIKKAQLTSSATNVLISLILTGVVISAIFTGGLSLGVLAVAAMIMTSIKIAMDIHLANKETNLKKEFFESKVLTAIEEMKPNVHEKYERLIAVEDKTVIMATIALTQDNCTDSEVIEYVLNQRQGYFENAKMRNTRIGFAALGLGIWFATNYLTLGLAGVVLSIGATALSVVASIIDTKYLHNALGSDITEWFRTFFSKKKGEDFDLYDYKNKEIVSFINDIKTNNLSAFFDNFSSHQSSYSKIRENLNFTAQANTNQNNTIEYNKETFKPTPNATILKEDEQQNITAPEENDMVNQFDTHPLNDFAKLY
jgi:hypothetical protein